MACRDSDPARIHGEPSLAKRIIIFRQSLGRERAAREKREQEIRVLEDEKKQLADELAKSQKSEQVISEKLGNFEEVHNSLMEEVRRKEAVAENLASVAARQATASEEIAADVQRRLIAVETERAQEIVEERQRIADVEDRLSHVTADAAKAAAEENTKTAEASCRALRERVVEVENARRCAEEALPDIRAAAETEILMLGSRAAQLEEKYAQQAQKALDARNRTATLEREVMRLHERLAVAEEDGARANRKVQEVRASAATTERSLMGRLKEEWETRSLHLQHESQRTVVAEERAVSADLEITQLRKRLVDVEEARVTAERAVVEVTATATEELVSVRQSNVEEQKKLELRAAATATAAAAAAAAAEKAEATELHTAEILKHLAESEKARANAETVAETSRATVEELKTTVVEQEATHVREKLALKHEYKEMIAREAKETQEAAGMELASIQKRAVEDSDTRLALSQEATARELADARESTKEATQKVTVLISKMSAIEQREVEVGDRHRRTLEEMELRLKASDEQQAKLDRHIAELQKSQLALGEAKVAVTKHEAALAAAKVLKRSPDTVTGSATTGERGAVPRGRHFHEKEGRGGRRSPNRALTSDVGLGRGRDQVLDCAEIAGAAARLVWSNSRLLDRRVSTCAPPPDLSGSGAESYNARNFGEGVFDSRSQFDRWSGGRGGGKGRKNSTPIVPHVVGGVTYSATLCAVVAAAVARGARAGVLAGNQAAACSLEAIRGGMASGRSQVGTLLDAGVSRGTSGSQPPLRRPLFE